MKQLFCLCRWYRRTAWCVLLLLLGAPTLCAQTTDTTRTDADSLHSSKSWIPSVRTLGTDALDIARAPLRLTSPDQFVLASASGLALGALLTIDAPTHRGVRSGGAARSVTGPLAGPGRWYDQIGPNRAALGTAGLLAASGLVLQDKDLTHTSVRVVESLVYTNLVTGALKSIVGRARPHAGEGPRSVDLKELESDHNELSMPSGHTARAFALASVLAHEADRWYVSVPSYGMAASVGVERIRSGDHWMTDVIVGGVLGYLIGRSVTEESFSVGNTTFNPLLSPRRLGVSVHF